MKYSIGDKLQVHCYKHNGKINSISDEAIVLEETEEMLKGIGCRPSKIYRYKEKK